MPVPFIAVALLSCIAQHSHDPFSGSGCNCSAFCAGSCAINASKPGTRTLYRMTPLEVDSLADKNTGDAPGDTSYVISRRTAAFDCKKDPGSFQCANLVVTGDDPDSTVSVCCCLLLLAATSCCFLLLPACCLELTIPSPEILAVTRIWSSSFRSSLTGSGGLTVCSCCCCCCCCCFNRRSPSRPHYTRPPLQPVYCNPLDAKHPAQPWNCSTDLSGGPGPPPGYPKTCAAEFDGFAKFCLHGKPDSVVKSASGISGCCAAAKAAKAESYTFHTSNSSCEIHQTFSFHQSSFYECADGVVGLMTHGPPLPPCQCPRVFTSVGRENLTASGSHGSGFGGAGGEWLSHPHQGMCAPGAPVGTDGCSWRVAGTPLAVNASCVYNRIDNNVEAANVTGFAPCPKTAAGGLNRTSDCYSESYKYTTDAMTPTELVAPWKGSFSGSEPCPPVSITASRVLAAVAAAATR